MFFRTKKKDSKKSMFEIRKKKGERLINERTKATYFHSKEAFLKNIMFLTKLFPFVKSKFNEAEIKWLARLLFFSSLDFY